MDLYKEIDSNRTVLLLLPSMQYNKISLNIIKKLSKSNLCYITLNKTQAALKETFKKKKIVMKNIIFIDSISKSIKEPGKVNNCYFVSSPAALTELSIVINEFLKYGFDYIVFDSLTNLLIYQKSEPVTKFVSNLVNKISGTKTKAVFYALNVKDQEGLIKECSMFFDRVINLEKQTN